MASQLFKTKTLSALLNEAEQPEYKLKRSLGAIDLTALGVGAVIGAGIFAITGNAAAGDTDRPASIIYVPLLDYLLKGHDAMAIPGHIGAGPAIAVSFILLAFACSFSALCYAELASMIPIAGSAYTYAYATLGELFAWIIGWDLILEYIVGNIAVAVGWSGYFDSFLKGFGVNLPAWAINPYGVNGGVVNIPGVVIVLLVTIVLVIGIRESSTANNIMVGIKLIVISIFLAVGAFWVKPQNWHPFAPNGFQGILSGAALVFFAYIGFDAVSTAAEECRTPQRDLPVGIIASLAICTVLYVAVAFVLTGIVPYQTLNNPAPVANALLAIKQNWAAFLVSAGALVGMTSVLLVFQLGQPRIFFSMSRDHLLPFSDKLSAVHKRFKTPHVTTILTGLVVAGVAAFVDIGTAAELTNIGTFFAFILVCAGVIVLRRTNPQAPRPFQCPLVPFVPVLGILFCVLLMLSLPIITWLRFLVWLLIGLAIYFFYGHKHSKLRGSSP